MPAFLMSSFHENHRLSTLPPWDALSTCSMAFLGIRSLTALCSSVDIALVLIWIHLSRNGPRGPSSLLGTMLRWGQGLSSPRGEILLTREHGEAEGLQSPMEAPPLKLLLFNAFYLLQQNNLPRKFIQFSARVMLEHHSFIHCLYIIYVEPTMCQALAHAIEQDKHGLPSKADFLFLFLFREGERRGEGQRKRKSSSTMVNSNGESRHPCLVPDLRGKFFPIVEDISSGSFIYGLYDVEVYSLYPYFVEGFKSGKDTALCQMPFLHLLMVFPYYYCIIIKEFLYVCY